MNFFDIIHNFQAFLFLSYVLGVTGYSEMRQPIMYGDITPQLSQTKDSRRDGIAYEANRAMIALHLKETYAGKALKDFSLPGTQKLKLEYGDYLEAKKSDTLLEVLQTLALSDESTWDIDITGYGTCLGNRTLLSNVFHRLPAITSLHWRNGEPIPVDIVRFLEAMHSLCRLYYELPLVSWGRERTEKRTIDRRDRSPEAIETRETLQRDRAIARESILNSTIPYALKVEIINGGRDRQPWKMDLILRILASCPNIKELDILVMHGRGCVHYATDDPYGFDFTSSNATLAPLESLTVDGYRFAGKPDGQNWMEWESDRPKRQILYGPWKYLPDSIIEYIGYPKIQSLGGLESSFVKRDTSPLEPGTKTNLDIWKERMDWTHLHTLNMKSPSSYELESLGGSTLPSLRNVEFSGYYASHHAILSFLSNISTDLESIQFDGINFCSLTEAINTIAEHHGASLHTFVHKHSQPYHSRSRTRTPYRFPSTSFLNVTHLTQLRDNAPGLTTLDLDVQVSEEWDYELLDTLVSFPELVYLTLRFEAQNDDWDEFDDYGYAQYGDSDQYRSNEDEASLMMGLKAYLAKQKVGKRFQRLEIWVGSELTKDIAELC